jgi:hypothetical protein
MNYSLISQPDRIRIPDSDSEEEEEENKRKKAKVVEESSSRSIPGFVTITQGKRNSKDIPIKVDGMTFICIKFNF